jgi:hypothetical protein
MLFDEPASPPSLARRHRERFRARSEGAFLFFRVRSVTLSPYREMAEFRGFCRRQPGDRCHPVSPGFHLAASWIAVQDDESDNR